MSRRVFCVAMAIMLAALMAIGCGKKGSNSGELVYRDLGIRLTVYDTETGRPLFKGAESYFSAVQHATREGVEIEIVAKEGIDAKNMWVDLVYNPEFLNPIKVVPGEGLGEETIFMDVKHLKGVLPVIAGIHGDYLFEGGTYATVSFSSEEFKLDDKETFVTNPEAPLDLTYVNEEDGIRITWTTNNAGDYNGDGTVNGLDLFMIAANFRAHPSIDGGRTYCIDGDGNDTIEGLDVFLISVHYLHAVQGYQIQRAVDELGPFSPIASPFLVNDGNPYYIQDDPCVHLNGVWDYLDDDNGQGLDDGFYFYRMEVVDFSMQTVVVGDVEAVLRGPIVYPLAPENVEVFDGFYENVIQWTIPDDETITGFNLYRMYTQPDGLEPPGLIEIPYDFGKPINNDLVPLNEDPLDLDDFFIDRDPPDVDPEQANLFRNGEYYYVVKSFNSYLVESENDEASEAGPGYPYSAALITDTGNNRVVVSGTNFHPNHEPAEQIIWDSSVDPLYEYDFDLEDWFLLDPPGLSNPTMARFFPNVTGDDNELSHLVICDNGNDRLIVVNWTSMPSPFCWAVVGMEAPWGVDIDDHLATSQEDPNYYITSGNNFPDDYPEDLGNLLFWNQDPAAEFPFNILRYGMELYSCEYVEEMSHPDVFDDADDGDDPDYTGPALVMAQMQPGMEGDMPVMNVVELADVWLPDPMNFLQWEGVFDTQNIAACGNSSVGFISYSLGDPADETLQFAGLDWDKTTEEVDANWFFWSLDGESNLQVNTSVEDPRVFPRGVNFVGQNPSTLNFTWSDGFLLTLQVMDFTSFYIADATELALNNPTYYEWMIKPEWIEQ